MNKFMVALAALSVSGFASAATIDNVTVGFTDVEAYQGLNFGVEKSITDQFYVGGAFQGLEHVDNANLQTKDVSAKVGAIHALDATTDLYGEFVAGRLMLDTTTERFSEDYVGLEFGVKGDLSQVAPLSYTAYVGTTNYVDLEETYYAGVGLDYDVTDTFALSLGYKFEAYDSADVAVYGEEDESQFYFQTKFKF